MRLLWPGLESRPGRAMSGNKHMSLEIKIPAVGESVTSGIISEWRRKNGDTVAAGEVLFLLETDKISTEISAERGGVLEIRVKEGQEVKIGEVVGVLTDLPTNAASAPAQKADDVPTTKVQSPALFRPGIQPAALPVHPTTGTRAASAEVKPPPLAVTPVVPPAQLPNTHRETRRPMTSLRRKIAAQLVNAQQTAAILTTFNECDMSAIMALRKEIQEDFTTRHGVKLGFMSFFVKATVEALRRVPQLNGRIEGEELIENHYYDIGVAVSTERGLLVPVLRDADKKSFADIERELADYAIKAREGKIKIEDLQGGVFTISNGGVFGSLLSTPILNPPQSGILGMHSIKERPVALHGEVVIRPMMYLALSYDHRIVDGREAVTFLVHIKNCIEQPARLLLQT